MPPLPPIPPPTPNGAGGPGAAGRRCKSEDRGEGVCTLVIRVVQMVLGVKGGLLFFLLVLWRCSWFIEEVLRVVDSFCWCYGGVRGL